MGSLQAAGNLSTAETQQGDDDLAVGLLVKAVAESPYASDTLVVIIEDDCQDGPDHVDSHRSPRMCWPYVKAGSSRQYTLYARSMRSARSKTFLTPTHEPETRRSSGRWPMCSTCILPASGPTSQSHRRPRGNGNFGTVDVPGLQIALGPIVKPKHDAAYWDKSLRVLISPTLTRAAG